MNNPPPKKLLLHCCCAPCGTHPFRLLQGQFNVTAYFDNPNIYPPEEHRVRLDEIRRLAERWIIPLEVGECDPNAWFEAVKGHENEPEGSIRCEICYRFRLEKTARKAKTLHMDFFATTLSISPHKKTETINRIGLETAERFGVRFLEADFKKKDGFKLSCEISRAEGLYRQHYCGCMFSQKQGREPS